MKCRVRLLRRCGVHTSAHTTALRTCLKSRNIALGYLALTRLTHQLINRCHVSKLQKTISMKLTPNEGGKIKGRKFKPATPHSQDDCSLFNHLRVSNYTEVMHRTQPPRLSSALRASSTSAAVTPCSSSSRLRRRSA